MITGVLISILMLLWGIYPSATAKLNFLGKGVMHMGLIISCIGFIVCIVDIKRK